MLLIILDPVVEKIMIKCKQEKFGFVFVFGLNFTGKWSLTTSFFSIMDKLYSETSGCSTKYSFCNIYPRN